MNDRTATSPSRAASGELELNIKSDPANLASVRLAVEAMCRDGGFDTTAVDEIGLCVNEALANVIRHAYKGAIDRPIEIRATCRDGEAVVQIRDWGNGMNPADL